MAERADRSTERSNTPLRVATWNMNHWQQPMLPVNTRRAAWEYLTNAGVDVVLAQEAAPTSSPSAVYGEIGGHRNWGSGVVALNERSRIEPIRSVRGRWSRRRLLLEPSHSGSVAIARVRVGDLQPITFVSIYAVWDESPVASMLRAVADLYPLFDSPDGARVVLGGDFNVSRSTADSRYVAQAEAVIAAVRSLGLIEAKGLVTLPPARIADCPCTGGPVCGHVPTWRGSELDHLFVSSGLASQVTALTIDPAAVSAGLSDHVPMVLDMGLTTERTPQTWDDDAFAVEIGRRHGAATREVVEQLVNWADVRERELRRATGVQAKTLTSFWINGRTTEPELTWRLNLETEPKAAMSLFSIHANGNVVIHFGGMSVPPCDAPARRKEILPLLNEIDGVNLGASAVYRWPRFPLELLMAPDNLTAFVTAIDRVAEESRSMAMRSQYVTDEARASAIASSRSRRRGARDCRFS
jgi:exonuclease III